MVQHATFSTTRTTFSKAVAFVYITVLPMFSYQQSDACGLRVARSRGERLLIISALFQVPIHNASYIQQAVDNALVTFLNIFRHLVTRFLVKILGLLYSYFVNLV